MLATVDRVMPLVVVQRIDVRWTKRERDAASRERRARLPRGYPIPEGLVRSNHACVRHFADVSGEEWAEEDDALTTARGAAARTTASVRLEVLRDELRVSFAPGDAGEPMRERKSIRLRPGAWARGQYNGRFRPTEPERKIIDIAFRIPPTRNMFMGEPPMSLNALADLW